MLRRAARAPFARLGRGLALAVVAGLLLVGVCGCAASAGPTAPAGASGLPLVALADLPPQAGDTVALIHSGGPFPYPQDGETFFKPRAGPPQRAHGLLP